MDVGVAMSIVASISSNMGMNMQKLSFLRESVKARDRQRSYVRQPIWLLGLLVIIIGSVGDFAALGFAAQSLIAPVGGMTLVANIFFAFFFLGERVPKRDVFATLLIMGGIVVITIFGNKEEGCYDLDDLIDRYQRTPFASTARPSSARALCYIACGRRCGKRKALGPSSKDHRRVWRKVHRFCFPCPSGITVQSVIFAKSLAELIKHSFEVENQFAWTDPANVGCILSSA